MKGPPSLLALAIILVAGCAQPSDESSDDGARSDPNLLVVQFVDVTAPAASDCLGAGAREVPPARFPTPADARWARFETTFASGKAGVEVQRGEGTRIGFASGSSPVVVVVEEVSLAAGEEILVRAFTCEGGADQLARVTATFRRAAP